MFKVTLGILIPFFGTVMGSALVFFMKKDVSKGVKSAISGFAGGVMIAASVWSLLIPAIESSSWLGAFSFAPALAGIFAGVLFMYGIDKLVPVSESGSRVSLPIAVTVHNFPEGMAVGVVYASLVSDSTAALAPALAVSIGIAIQNLPEGAIISIPLCAKGQSRIRAFIKGALSGVVEPIGAALVLLATGLLSPILPFVLALSAGAMIYVVVCELVPEATCDPKRRIGVIAFIIGFSLMMTLDVALS